MIRLSSCGTSLLANTSLIVLFTVNNYYNNITLCHNNTISVLIHHFGAKFHFKVCAQIIQDYYVCTHSTCLVSHESTIKIIIVIRLILREIFSLILMTEN